MASLTAGLPASALRFLVRQAARAHPGLKTPLFERFFTAVARGISYDSELIETNMGISSHLKCRLPLAKSSYVFGRVQNSLSDRATWDLMRHLSVDCSNFIDVGANEGLFTFAIYALGGNIDIHFFEPDERLYERLQQNLLANNIRVNGIKAAVARLSGSGTFFKNLDDDCSGSLTNYFSRKHRTSSEVVRTISLEDYFGSRDIDKAFVKIDVEGAGSDVWAGATQAIPKIRYLIIEIIEPEVKSNLPQRIIRETGWEAYYIKDYELIRSADGEFTYVPPFWNWLFCNLSPAALAERLSGTAFRVVKAART
jgi:FkbM family methyltransferase